jgi:glycosyltransferase involved in cell wall biosynthesis
MRDVNYMYNFIDINDYKFETKKEDYLLFFSRISKEKGVHNFVEICKELKCKGIIAGEDNLIRGIESNYLIELLKEIINANREGADIEYLGSVSEEKKVELLSRAKAVVIPYEWPYFEVFGIAIVESLAVGTPVLTLKGFGGPDEIINEKVGYLAKDLEDLKNKCKEVLEDKIFFDPKECRERAKDFDINKIMNEYIKNIV